MKTNFIPDYDVMGIIFDYASDDANLFLVIVNNKLCMRELDVSKLNWDKISFRNDLSFDFVDEYAYHLNWDILSRHNVMNISFLKRYQDIINWESISGMMSFIEFQDYDVFEEFGHKLDWNKISKWAMMCEEFVDRFSHKVNWNVLSSYQNLTTFLIHKYYDRINWNLYKACHQIEKTTTVKV